MKDCGRDPMVFRVDNVIPDPRRQQRGL